MKGISLSLAFLGILILLRPWNASRFFTYLLGDLLALLNGLLYSVYLIIGRKESHARKSIPSSTSISLVLLWSLLTSFFFIPSLSYLLRTKAVSSFSFQWMFSSKIILLGLGLAFFGSILPYFLLMLVARKIEASTLGILVLGEPLGAIILGLIILKEPISINYLLGGGLLLLAIIILVLHQEKTQLKGEGISSSS